MPLSHVRYQGEELTPQELLDKLARREYDGGIFTYELASAMLATHQERGTRISTTSLTSKCVRSEAMQRLEPYVKEFDQMYASFRGTMYHGQLETHAAPGSIAEARFHVELEGLGPLSGSPDLVDVEHGILYDYKTSKEVPRFDRAWPNAVEQMQINRWLVDHATAVEIDGKKYTSAKKLEACRPVDWQALILVYMDNVTVKPIRVWKSIQVPTKVEGKTKPQRVDDIWDDERVEALIRERYSAVKEAFAGVIPEIPGPEWADGNHPLCSWCPVKQRCLQMQHAETNEKETV